jgi:hypothetical protein
LRFEAAVRVGLAGWGEVDSFGVGCGVHCFVCVSRTMMEFAFAFNAAKKFLREFTGLYPFQV